jgi:outer membrane protein
MLDTSSGRSFDVGVQSRTATLALNIPLYTGGISQSKVRQQASLLDKAQSQLDLADRTARQDAKSAFLAVNTGLSQVSALQTAIQSSELALQANKKGYEVGVRVNIDVLNAQQQLSATQRDLSKAKYNALISMLELRGSVGDLTASSLEEINALLLPLP